MKSVHEALARWAVQSIDTAYPEDISLLVGHSNFLLDKDAEGIVPSYYIPRTDRGMELQRAFLIGGVGYNLFPMSWERVHGLSRLEEAVIATWLGDGVVLWARSERDRARFLELQRRLSDNLGNPLFTRQRAQEKCNRAMGQYTSLLFQTDWARLRKASGSVLISLCESIACLNGVYLKQGPTNLDAAIASMETLPGGFLELMRALPRAQNERAVKETCYALITSVRGLLTAAVEQEEEEEDCEQALADWYGELSYTWRRIAAYCENGDVENAYLWGCLLQRRLDIISEELSLTRFDLMDAFQSDRLSAFAQRAAQLETQVLALIQRSNADLHRYGDMEAFLAANQVKPEKEHS